MEIYVVKNKKTVKDIILGNEPKYKYKLIYNQDGYIHIDCFESRECLKDRLINKPLYKDKYFPKENLSLEQFIDNGYSIYY